MDISLRINYYSFRRVFNEKEKKITHSICTECSDKRYGTENWSIDMKIRI